MYDIKIEELLGRELLIVEDNGVSKYIENHVILVTGGGGSIGSELCRQIAMYHPKRLIILDAYENNAYYIDNELKQEYGSSLDLITLIGHVQDESVVDNVFKKYCPEIVFHAAAYKHVPMMEINPNECIKNNVFGTLALANAAVKYKTDRFILISTDKAVNPTNIMGATKRICEMVIQDKNSHSTTDFVAVRFGNVIGSNGSVIPLFIQQIEAGGPITVTHPDISRFFMTITESVTLVLQAGSQAQGGEIFVLDMGEPIKIVDLAEKLISSYGYIPYQDIEISFSGLRPGEKLYEELIMDNERLEESPNKLIHICKTTKMEDDLEKKLNDLKINLERYDIDIRYLVKKIVTSYNY